MITTLCCSCCGKQTLTSNSLQSHHWLWHTTSQGILPKLREATFRSCGKKWVPARASTDGFRVLEFEACSLCAKQVSLEEHVSMMNVDQVRIFQNVQDHLIHQERHEVNACQCLDLKTLICTCSSVESEELASPS